MTPSPISCDADVQAAAHYFAAAERILFITGAGVSAESGLPTYRGLGGLYEDRLTDEGLSIEQALSGPMLAQRPEVTWKYLAEIERNCRGAQPNVAHWIMAALEPRREGVVVLTQNIDGLHRRAGSEEVIEIHGRMHHLICQSCHHHRQVDDFDGLTLPPPCPLCGGLMRPDVVLFGEMLPEAETARLEYELQVGFDLVVSIGTTSVFPYIAAPVEWARWAGVPSIEINPGATEVSHRVNLKLPLVAGQALSQIWQQLYPNEALPGAQLGSS